MLTRWEGLRLEFKVASTSSLVTTISQHPSDALQTDEEDEAGKGLRPAEKIAYGAQVVTLYIAVHKFTKFILLKFVPSGPSSSGCHDSTRSI